MNRMRNSNRMVSSVARLARIGVCALAATAPATAQISGSGGGSNVPTEWISLNILSPGQGATGSSAAAIAMGCYPGNCGIVGGTVQVGQVSYPAAWITNETVDGPFRFLHAGHGGRISRGAAASGFFDMWEEARPVFAGSVFDAQGRTRPAFWTVNRDGSNELHLLPAQHGGEALGVTLGDINNDGLSDIVVCGYQGGVDDNTSAWATVWTLYGNGSGDGDDQIEQTVLPGQVASPLNRANAISFDFDRLDIAATYGGPEGASCKCVSAWVPCDNGFSVIDVADGATARTETVDNNETITIGGSLVNPGGGTTPALFTIDDNGVSTRTLPVLDGTSNTMMHGIIAILIGLYAGGEMQTPQGRSAVIWSVTEEGARILDLNRVVSRPRGMRLNCVNMLLPYMEQDNLYRAVGDATNAAGQMRGFVVTR